MSRSRIETTADEILADRDAVVALLPHLARWRGGEDTTTRWIESGRDLRYTTPEMLLLEERMLSTPRGGDTPTSVWHAMRTSRRRWHRGRR